MTVYRGEASDRLLGFDFAAHNVEQKQAWAAQDAGTPYRVPIVLGTNSRYFMRQPSANPQNIDFRTYSTDPDLMFDCLLQFQRWNRFNLLQDGELGLPASWSLQPDFQNYYESAWFGCPVEYLAGEVPDTRPAFADCPERVMEGGIPDPFAGIMAKVLEYYEHFAERAPRATFMDRPVTVPRSACGAGTDGPMTVACNLFGPSFVCEALATDPGRMHRLFDFITEATLARMVAWRGYLGLEYPKPGFGMADDSIALISTRMYRDHILPYHRRFYDLFGTDAGRGIHLCGDSTRHFKTLRDELHIRTFDTGFPVDFAALRRELGPDVRIFGGPHVELLRSSTPEQVRHEVQRILGSGVLEGGRFVLREGNNLAPGTPLENTEALYKAGREFGVFGSGA